MSNTGRASVRTADGVAQLAGDARHEVPTYCRICEPQCGVIATVEGDRIVSVRPDRRNPHSQGFMCAKAPAMVEVVEDPDRVVTPLRRVGTPGEFEPVSWEAALDEIASRLGALLGESGGDAFATFFGNPSSFNTGSVLWAGRFNRALGSRWMYGVGGEDGASMSAASALMFGSPTLLPKPDLWRSRFAIVIGANPFVSHGSAVSEPQIRAALASVVERGGRVVVVDPRRTETARRFEHLPIRPGTDAWLLAAMVNVMIRDGRADTTFIAQHCRSFDQLCELVTPVTPLVAEARCGVPAPVVTALATDFAASSPAVVYGRTGTCTQRFGTLNNMLQAILNVITGNIERPGGAVFGWSPVDFGAEARRAGADTYGAIRSRTLGLPDVSGTLPSQSLARDITTPGPGRIRALLTLGGNPVHSSGAGGEHLAAALEVLDLHVSLDLYVNETNKYAHFVLPATTFYERADFPVKFASFMLRPALYATRAVVAPRGEAREEWTVLADLAHRLGRPIDPPRLGDAELGPDATPLDVIDGILRAAASTDDLDVPTLDALLERHPHGIKLMDHVPVRPIGDLLTTPDGRVDLAPTALAVELARLQHDVDPSAYPYRLIGMREIRSQNTWMHNVASLMPESRRVSASISPADAADLGLADGDEVLIESGAGSVTACVTVTADMMRGAIALPHGWGHNGGWRRANAAGGPSSNDLASSEPADIEPLAGMSILNGIPVRLRAARL